MKSAARSDPASLHSPGQGDLRSPRFAKAKKKAANYRLPSPIGGKTLSGMNPQKLSVSKLIGKMRGM